jgi:uroporphyrinogen decarboxylase
MEARLARFEEQVNAAQRAAPPSKGWVRQALRRRGTGRCPVRLKRLSLDVALRHGQALAELFCQYPDDVVALIPYDFAIGYQDPQRRPRLNPVEIMTRQGQWVDEWGTRWGHAYGGVGATPVDYPLKSWDQLDEYLEKFPDPLAPGRLDAIMPLFEMHRADRYCIGVIHLVLFERLHCLRSMEDLFADFYTGEKPLRRLLGALADYALVLIRRWGELGVDAVFLTDDWGSQTGLMISPAMWRDFFKDHYRALFAEAHRHRMEVIFHSCGQVMDIVEDLIELGLDVLDPVQPGAMDLEEVARRFGGRVSFSGAVDLQRLFLSTPAQIRDEVRHTIDTLGRGFGGGLLAGPANVLTPEVPIENLGALFAACHED